MILNCLRKRGQFPLRSLLRQRAPIHQHQDFLVFEADGLPNIDFDQFLYFGASIFWRSSATRWKITKTLTTTDTLGPKYREEFRAFLNDESDFPENAYIMISVSAEDDLYPMLTWPSSIRVRNHFKHVFYIPGLEYRLILGNRLPRSVLDIKSRFKSGRLFFAEPFKNGTLYRYLQEDAAVFKKAGSLKRN